MPIFKKIEEIPYNFLRETINNIDKEFKKCYMDSEGGCAITFSREMSEEEICEVLRYFNPYAISVEIFENYDYKNGDTIIFTPEGIDYREVN